MVRKTHDCDLVTDEIITSVTVTTSSSADGIASLSADGVSSFSAVRSNFAPVVSSLAAIASPVEATSPLPTTPTAAAFSPPLTVTPLTSAVENWDDEFDFDDKVSSRKDDGKKIY